MRSLRHLLDERLLFLATSHKTTHFDTTNDERDSPVRRLWPIPRRRLVVLDGTEAGLWREAARHVPFKFRWLGRSLDIATVDTQVAGMADWQDLRACLEPRDRICPFTINRNTLAMRQGFVVIRNGMAIGGVVTLGS